MNGFINENFRNTDSGPRKHDEMDSGGTLTSDQPKSKPRGLFINGFNHKPNYYIM